MNPSTAQGQIVVDELIRGGVQEAVLCSGSRHAPLAFALSQADTAGRLRLHMRIDERTAGFLALGLAITSKRPVPIIMTSGTAVANLGPAVLEANYARVPLLVISANRPYEVLGSGANQTIEQFGLFGTQVRGTMSLAQAIHPEQQNSHWRTAICRALTLTQGTRTTLAGPVHIDIPIAEPLVPDKWPDNSAQESVLSGRPQGASWTTAPEATIDAPLAIDLNLNTIVIAGHGAGFYPELDMLPTIFEPTAPFPSLPINPFGLPHLHPQQVIITGRPTLHRSVAQLLANPAIPVYAFTTGPRWPDISGNIRATGTRPVISGTPNPEWIKNCRHISQQALTIVDRQLELHPHSTGLHVAAAMNETLREREQLILGASNPIRDAALVGMPKKPIVVQSNRGVAGIDGVVSAVIGSALAYEKSCPSGRTLALLGDLTFIHDSSGLLIGDYEPRPTNLTIVVANDTGGGIFELLEQGDPKFASTSERLFGTPHNLDLSTLCGSYGVNYDKVSPAELTAQLSQERKGFEVLEVRTERKGLRQLHADIVHEIGQCLR